MTKELQDKYPLMTLEFEKILIELDEMFYAKQNDYGTGNICEDVDDERERKKAIEFIVIRLRDKYNRLKNLTFNNSEPKNETVEDTYKDLALYSIISLLVKRQVWGK